LYLPAQNPRSHRKSQLHNLGLDHLEEALVLKSKLFIQFGCVLDSLGFVPLQPAC